MTYVMRARCVFGGMEGEWRSLKNGPNGGFLLHNPKKCTFYLRISEIFRTFARFLCSVRERIRLRKQYRDTPCPLCKGENEREER